MRPRHAPKRRSRLLGCLRTTRTDDPVSPVSSCRVERERGQHGHGPVLWDVAEQRPAEERDQSHEARARLLTCASKLLQPNDLAPILRRERLRHADASLCDETHCIVLHLEHATRRVRVAEATALRLCSCNLEHVGGGTCDDLRRAALLYRRSQRAAAGAAAGWLAGWQLGAQRWRRWAKLVRTLKFWSSYEGSWVATGAPSPKCVAASLPACSNVNTGFPGIFGNAPSGEV